MEFAFEALFLLLSMSPPDGKSQAEEKQVGALLQHLLHLSDLKFVADVVVFANVLLFFYTEAFVLPNSHLFPFHPLVQCPFGVG